MIGVGRKAIKVAVPGKPEVRRAKRFASRLSQMSTLDTSGQSQEAEENEETRTWQLVMRFMLVHRGLEKLHFLFCV